jgi:hypothetical protein
MTKYKSLSMLFLLFIFSTITPMNEQAEQAKFNLETIQQLKNKLKTYFQTDVIDDTQFNDLKDETIKLTQNNEKNFRQISLVIHSDKWKTNQFNDIHKDELKQLFIESEASTTQTQNIQNALDLAFQEKVGKPFMQKAQKYNFKTDRLNRDINMYENVSWYTIPTIFFMNSFNRQERYFIDKIVDFTFDAIFKQINPEYTNNNKIIQKQKYDLETTDLDTVELDTKEKHIAYRKQLQQETDKLNNELKKEFNILFSKGQND